MAKDIEPYHDNPMTRPRIIIHYSGLFDFEGLYALVVDWAKNEQYMWTETDYKHKVPSPRGAEQEFKWNMFKKVTEYITFEIKMEVHIWNMLDVDVNVNNRKKTLTSGKVYIWIDSNMGYDWQKRFKGSSFLLFLNNLYHSLIFRQKFENLYGEQIFYRSHELQGLIKKFFDMQAKKYAYEDYLKEK